MECIITVDVLRRSGVHVDLAGVSGKGGTKCSRGVVVLPDIELSEAKGPFDAIILPGGLGGSKAFCESKALGEMLKEQEPPTALRTHCVGFGKNLTSYPSVESQVMDGGNYTYKEDEVVVDGSLITSRGPGTAFKFALTLVEHLVGVEKAKEVARGMLTSY
ncbi:hypothetical protein RI129_007951 [Pyrocoelia pectoralis]|uniref:DJ-1/PfpI domain-containing protein n=1 Tax=Pyrocoelia pectoralis TaxID=417401 RepID=A0AAN7ZNB5_9COLE